MPITPSLARCRYLLIASLLLLTSSATATDINRELEDIANRLTTKIAATGKTSIAIADLTDLQGVVHQLGRFISEEVSINLILAAPKFTVIDRNHLRTILREQKLSMSGLMDPKNQKKLGKILGVDALLLGSITPFGEIYRITFKVVATDTAQVVAADRGSIPKTPATNELWDTVIEDDGIVSVASGSSTTSGSGYSRPAKKGVFRNQYVEIAIESMGLRKDKKELTMVLRLTNLTKGDIYIAETDNSNIVDDSGVTWDRDQLSGLTVFPRTSDRFYQGSPFNPDSYLTLMTKGQSQPINYVFRPHSGASNAKLLSLSSTIYIKVPAKAGEDSKDSEWRYITVGVGISGIKVH